MSLTVGTAIGAGQTWTIQNATSATITSKPAWMTATGAVSGNDYVYTLTGTPDNSAASFTLQASADNNNIPAGCAPTVTGQSVTSASVTVNCQAPVLGSAINPSTATINVAYTGSVTINNCTGYTNLLNLPAGLSAGAGSASGSDWVIPITGTPTATGTFNTITVDATNACGATTATTNSLNLGTLTVGATPACTAPAVSSTISVTTAPACATFSATIQVSNATSGVSITNLPSGLTQSVSYSAPNATITIGGAPASGTVGPAVNLLVDATNNPGGCTSNTQTGLAGGSLTVTANDCTTPSINATITPSSTYTNQAYSGTIKVDNATSATVNGLPGTLSQSFSAGTPATITITGTPTATNSYNLTVDATNAQAGVCCSKSVTGLNGGTLSVAAGVAFNGDCCGGDFVNPVQFIAYTPGDPAPALPFSPACNLGFTVTVCNDPTAAYLATSVYGFNDVVSCQPNPPGPGPFYAGWVYVNAAKNLIACVTAGENAFAGGTCPLVSCN